jgi:hypothetical protein
MGDPTDGPATVLPPRPGAPVPIPTFPFATGRLRCLLAGMCKFEETLLAIWKLPCMPGAGGRTCCMLGVPGMAMCGDEAPRFCICWRFEPWLSMLMYICRSSGRCGHQSLWKRALCGVGHGDERGDSWMEWMLANGVGKWRSKVGDMTRSRVEEGL